MAAIQIQLREAFKAAIQSAITWPAGTVFESRYMPRVNADGLEKLHVVFFLLDTSTETIAREVDTDEYVLAMAVQQHLRQPTATDVASDGENITHCDELVELVEQVKDLFRGDGPLRHQNMAGCRFTKMNQDIHIEPLHLAKYGIFTSIVDFTYRSESIDE